MLRKKWALVLSVAAWAIALGICAVAFGEEPNQLVQQAVRTELAADANDHSHWLYYEVDRKPENSLKQWVAQTQGGDLERVLEQNGRVLSPQEQRGRMDNFIRDSAEQAKRRKGNRSDDRQATAMLTMLPEAFIWTKVSDQDGKTVLHFRPNPQFRPPSYETRVFAAMEGDMTIDDAQHRIVSLKGKLIHDVKFGYGIFGELNAGGSFDVERRKVGDNEWQITETHVHIMGHALIFKNISEQEDDVKYKFQELPGTETFEEAEQKLLSVHPDGTEVASNRR